jgi:hypothetical protein
MGMPLVTDEWFVHNIDPGMVILDDAYRLAVVGNVYWSRDDDAWVIVLRGSARELVREAGSMVTVVL